jgi:enoyl-[acyl-carrier protein] reductase II
VRNERTNHYEQHPDELLPFPKMLIQSYRDQAWHLGAGDQAEGVDPATEGYPCGQGVGAIGELVPAAQVVADIVAEAERTLERLAAIKV